MKLLLGSNYKNILDNAIKNSNDFEIVEIDGDIEVFKYIESEDFYGTLNGKKAVICYYTGIAECPDLVVDDPETYKTIAILECDINGIPESVLSKRKGVI